MSIGKNEILTMLQELITQKEEDKSEAEIEHIISRFLIEKRITQHLTEEQIKAICRQLGIKSTSFTSTLPTFVDDTATLTPADTHTITP